MCPAIMRMSICLCLLQDWPKLENVKENNKEEMSNSFWLWFPLCVIEHQSPSPFCMTTFLSVKKHGAKNAEEVSHHFVPKIY